MSRLVGVSVGVPVGSTSAVGSSPWVGRFRRFKPLQLSVCWARLVVRLEAAPGSGRDGEVSP
jgi:hypothetical protein